MAETDTQTAAEAQVQTQIGETGSFAALLQQEFKPRTDRAREAVE
jgi:type VI secretion system protein ImpC